jgi:Bifunctional DNA primase/polymerase, N-terminal
MNYISECDTFAQPTLETALALAAEGIAVFPLIYRDKVPSKKSRGFYDATTNPAIIRRWFGGAVRWNLGVRTGQASGVWIVDEDEPGALDALIAAHGPLPPTRESSTGRGRHLWFKSTVLPIPSRVGTGRIWPGIDIKSERGYVVCPPSIHKSGVPYRWANDGPVAEAPSWLLVLARKPKAPEPLPTRSNASAVISGCPGVYGAAALRGEVEILASTAEGNRNNQANRTSFSLSQLAAGGELSWADAERAIVEACVVNGLVADDGLRSVMATIASGRRAGMQSPRNRGGRP